MTRVRNHAPKEKQRILLDSSVVVQDGAFAARLRSATLVSVKRESYSDILRIRLVECA